MQANGHRKNAFFVIFPQNYFPKNVKMSIIINSPWQYVIKILLVFACGLRLDML